MSSTRQNRQRIYEKLVGTSIAGRFRITNLLGFGGMGAVYEAVQHNMQRSVALKVIPSHDPTTTARFEREALTISRLNHPNTVTVFDYGKTDHGVLYLAMEMLTGQTLGDLLKARGALSPNEAVHVATQVCRSLSEAHRENIVHRDIKPDNIFLIRVDDDPLFVKVLDFGIAKILKGEDNVDLTGVDRIIGTPKYMSPEQILGEHVDHRSDIYSLGCIVFEMLCGTPPFRDSNTTKLMIAHAQQTPPTFAERLPNDALNRIPGPLEAVVRRALSKSPAQRYRDIDEFRDALQMALEATDNHLRVSELVGSTQIRPVNAINGDVTDSGDLLSQHSSQSLSRLRPLTGQQPQPQVPNASISQELSGPMAAPIGNRQSVSHQSVSHQSVSQQITPQPARPSKNRGPIYAIVVALLLIGAMGGYLVLKDKSADSSGSAPHQNDQAGVAPSAHQAAQRPSTTPNDEPEATKVTLKVLSEPSGARVYEEGRSVGRTPMTIYGKDGDTLHYSFEKDGYRPKLARFVMDSRDEEPVFSVKLDREQTDDKTSASSPPPRPRTTTKPASTSSKQAPTRPTSATKSNPKPAAAPTKDKERDKEHDEEDVAPAEEKSEPVRPSVPQLEDEKGSSTNIELL